MVTIEFRPRDAADPESVPRPVMRPDVANWVRCVLSTAADRCEMLGRELSMDEIMLQTRIRVLALNGGGRGMQIHAMRKFLALLLETRDKALHAGIWVSVSDAAPHGITIPDWLDSDWAAVEDAAALLGRQTCAGMMKSASAELEDMIAEMIRLGDFGTGGEIAVRLTGQNGAVGDSRRPPQLRWQRIDEAILCQLLEQLPPGEPPAALTAVANREFNHPALVRLIAWVTWLTGLRFIEVFRFRLMRPCAGSDLDSVLDDPLQACSDGGLADWQATVSAEDGSGRDRREDRPAIMIVDTAKWRTASPGIDNTKRSLILAGIPQQRLEFLIAASRLRSFRLGAADLTKIRCAGSAILNRASKDAFPERADPITFHTMRHAFADSARACMSPAAAAALTGHTTPQTLRGYGKRRRTGCSGVQPDRWLPQPDPSRVRRLSAEWEARRRPHPFADHPTTPDIPPPCPYGP